MSDTPRTDKIENDWKESWDRSTGQQEMSDFARQLERELNESHAMNAELRKASIDLLESLPMRSLPMVKCSQFHHERWDLHSAVLAKSKQLQK